MASAGQEQRLRRGEQIHGHSGAGGGDSLRV